MTFVSSSYILIGRGAPTSRVRNMEEILGEEVEDLNGVGRWVGSVAVVTGASSGIGAAICKNLLQSGINVIGFARRVHLVQELKEEQTDGKTVLFPLACDLRNEQKIVKAFQWIEKHFGGISILVNSAGVLAPTTLIDGSTDMWRRTVDVNFMAFALCTREAIKSMLKHKIDGHIVNINCICGHFIPDLPAPCYNVYSSTKYALTALSETTKRELDFMKSKIKVSMISPGFVDTELNNNAIDRESQKIFVDEPVLDVQDVADACVYLIGTPPHVVIEDIMIRTVGETI